MRRFFIPQGPAGPGPWRLTGTEAHHARNVMRLKPGASLVLVDGQGRVHLARLEAVDRAGLDLMILEALASANEPRLDLTLGTALLKADHLDLVIRAGTELGLTAFIPIKTERTTVRLPSDRVADRLKRWRRISEQAVKQCRRSRPVEILPLTDLAGFLAETGPTELKIMLHEGQPGRPETNWEAVFLRRPRPVRVAALVGPEGGFTEAEVDSARNAGFQILNLGPRILRSETAALALMAILGGQLGDLINFP
ncbi:MAG: RsmE family RNA methyltransferase [Thermodesulfobacteriota bacterium]